MSTSSNYLLLLGEISSTVCSYFGIYIQIEDCNGLPAYKQLHADERDDDDPGFLFYCLKSSTWIVSPVHGGPDGDGALRCAENYPKSSAVPTSGWQYNDDGVWRPIPGLDVTFPTDLSIYSTLCYISIKATGEAARRSSDGLGIFAPVPGEFRYGRQLFRNTTTDQKLMVNGAGFWVVGSEDGRCQDVTCGRRCALAWLASGSAPSMCPADPRAKVSDLHGTRNWRYATGEGLQESSAIKVTCAQNIREFMEQPDVDDLVKYIEGSEESQVNKKKKKHKKKKKINASASKKENESPENDATCVKEKESIMQGDDIDGLEALGAVDGAARELDSLDIDGGTKNIDIAKRIAKNAKAQLGELRNLELEKEEIERKIQSNTEDFQVHFKKKEHIDYQQGQVMTKCLLDVSKVEKKKQNCEEEMNILVNSMEELKKKQNEVEKKQNELKKKLNQYSNDLKKLKKRKTTLEKNKSELNGEMDKVEYELKVEQDNLHNALKNKEKQIENLARPEGERNRNDQNNNGIVDRITRSIQLKKEAIDDLVEDLECPVCLDTVQVPVFMCELQHVICSSCRHRQGLDTCPKCRTPYPPGPPRRHMYAERELNHLSKMAEELVELKAHVCREGAESS